MNTHFRFFYKASVLAFALTVTVLSLSCCGKKDNTPAEKPGDKPAITSSLTVDISKVINGNIIGGGVNFSFSDWLYYDFVNKSGFNQHLPVEEDQWDDYLKAIDFIGMQYVRFQVQYVQWAPVSPFDVAPDRRYIFSPNFRERPDAAGVPENTFIYMQKMYRLLDYFQQKGLYVILGNWTGAATQAANFCPPGNLWLTVDNPPPNIMGGLNVKSIDRFAEVFADMMYHLIVEKGYTCVKGFSIFNEPEHFVNLEEELTEAYNKCGAHLTRLGIRDKVKIQAFDGALVWSAQYGEGTGTLERMLKTCGDNMDILAFHHYQSTIEAETGLQGTIRSRLMKDIVAPVLRLAGNRPVIMSELGTFAYLDLLDDKGLYAKTIKLRLFNAEASTALFNGGVKGYGMWNYNTIFGPQQTMLDLVSGNLVPDAVNFYPSALMMKYLPAGTDIVQNTITGGILKGKLRIFATVGVKDGQTTILLVNDSEEAARVSITGVDTSKKYQYHYITEGKTDGVYSEPEVDLSKNKDVDLQPYSITVLTTYTYGAQTVH